MFGPTWNFWSGYASDHECRSRRCLVFILMFLHKAFTSQTRAGIDWLVHTQHSTVRFYKNKKAATQHESVLRPQSPVE